MHAALIAAHGVGTDTHVSDFFRRMYGDWDQRQVSAAEYGIHLTLGNDIANGESVLIFMRALANMTPVSYTGMGTKLWPTLERILEICPAEGRRELCKLMFRCLNPLPANEYKYVGIGMILNMLHVYISGDIGNVVSSAIPMIYLVYKNNTDSHMHQNSPAIMDRLATLIRHAGAAQFHAGAFAAYWILAIARVRAAITDSNVCELFAAVCDMIRQISGTDNRPLVHTPKQKTHNLWRMVLRNTAYFFIDLYTTNEHKQPPHGLRQQMYATGMKRILVGIFAAVKAEKYGPDQTTIPDYSTSVLMCLRKYIQEATRLKTFAVDRYDANIIDVIMPVSVAPTPRRTMHVANVIGMLYSIYRDAGYTDTIDRYMPTRPDTYRFTACSGCGRDYMLDRGHVREQYVVYVCTNKNCRSVHCYACGYAGQACRICQNPLTRDKSVTREYAGVACVINRQIRKCSACSEHHTFGAMVLHTCVCRYSL